MNPTGQHFHWNFALFCTHTRYDRERKPSTKLFQACCCYFSAFRHSSLLAVLIELFFSEQKLFFYDSETCELTSNFKCESTTWIFIFAQNSTRQPLLHSFFSYLMNRRNSQHDCLAAWSWEWNKKWTRNNKVFQVRAINLEKRYFIKLSLVERSCRCDLSGVLLNPLRCSEEANQTTQTISTTPNCCSFVMIESLLQLQNFSASLCCWHKDVHRQQFHCVKFPSSLWCNLLRKSKEGNKTEKSDCIVQFVNSKHRRMIKDSFFRPIRIVRNGEKKVRNVCLFTLVGIIGRARGFLISLLCVFSLLVSLLLMSSFHFEVGFLLCSQHPLNESC